MIQKVLVYSDQESKVIIQRNAIKYPEVIFKKNRTLSLVKLLTYSNRS